MFGSKPPVGVDIGSHSVKVCQLRRAGESYELEKFGFAEIYPQGDRPAEATKQREAKIEALRNALASAQIKSKRSISAVCGESIIVRYLQLPEMPEDELRKALQWEAEEYIPFRLNEVNIDSMILGHSTDGDHAKMDVLLVSAKKDLVEDHVSLIRAAGLEPQIVDVDAFAFLNCYEVNHRPGPDDCVALVNIGGEITSINIYLRGASRFSRDIPLGGDTMSVAIKSRLGCGFAEADRLKTTLGAPGVTPTPDATDERTFSHSLAETIRGTVNEMTNGAGEETPEALATKAIQTVMNTLLSEVRRSVEFFENQSRGLSVARVVLGGGMARLKNLPANFEKELQLPVETIDPLRHIRVAAREEQREQLSAVALQLGVGIGLGIRGLATA